MDDDAGTRAAQSVFFAGGGTGGHIYPNLAVLERLRERGVEDEAVFLLSRRPVDEAVITAAAGATPNETCGLPVRAWSGRPWRWPAFLKAWFQSKAMMHALIARTPPRALVATGGFVSGPAIVACAAAGVPVAMVNLDAVPGKANRRLARRADRVFTVYESPRLPGAQPIGMPLRRAAVGPDDQSAARRQLGLDPARPTLMVTGGSQGAASVNEAIITMFERDDARQALRAWQVLHLTGHGKDRRPGEAYRKLGVDALVMPYCQRMGLAWHASSVAVTRSGAGAVAEAWANATPCLFLPYPFHKDQHQRLNAQPMVSTGGAMLLEDRIDPAGNAAQLARALGELAAQPQRIEQMAAKLAATRPPDGADAVADWIEQALR